METGQIIDAFRNVGHHLPRAAIEAAASDRARHAPLFIAAFERYAENTTTDEATAEPLFFMFHLLGEWRETDAYRPLCRFLRCDSDKVETVLGDAITTTAHRVISAVFDGDPQPMFEIVLDPKADEYVRWNICETLAHLVLAGRVDRAIVSRFLRDCFSHLQPQRACHVWDGWVFAVAKLGLVEFRSLIEKVYQRGYADPGIASFKEFEDELALASDPSAAAKYCADKTYSPFADTIAEMSSWYCFSKAAQDAERREKARAAVARTRAGVPLPLSRKLAGRNEPCPCGSGKKHKQCCFN